ncbi:MAG TPA: heparinase II/III family protein [Chloroflexota bacterium]|nr:heparinase II/III family protein [Chloroflexota bacterium]
MTPDTGELDVAGRRKLLARIGAGGLLGLGAAACAGRPGASGGQRATPAVADRGAGTAGAGAGGPGAPPRGSGRHPNLTIDLQELAACKGAAPSLPAVSQAVQRAVQQGASGLSAAVTLPGPGGASSTQHKQNDQLAELMLRLGLAYALTGDERYATKGKDFFLAYAEQYPTLPLNPVGTTKGRLYWQSLDEAVWLTKLAQAYDFVYESPSLSAQQKATIERDLFRRCCAIFLQDDKTVDKTNNWATWACAAVVLTGYTIGDAAMVDQALLGTRGDRSRGYLWQLDTLFSPEGWYEEGASYAVYALLPFFYVAEAVERHAPQRSVYAYRNGILGKSIIALAQAAYPNGDYPALNDSPRPGGNISSLAWRAEAAYHRARHARLSADETETLLAIAARGGTRSVTAAGLAVAQALTGRAQPPRFAPRPVELSDGPTGGLGILRLTPQLSPSAVAGQAGSTGAGALPAPGQPAMALMKYGQLGGGHGHYDKLQLLFFAGGQEVLTDYGYVRFVGVEAKDGGRYLPENDSYGRSTVGHNTVVVDERRQSEGRHPNPANNAVKRWFDASRDAWQVVSASADSVNPGVAMERTVALAQPPGSASVLLLDLFRLRSDVAHRYDYTLHPLGELVEATVPLSEADEVLGPANGYQHLQLKRSGQAEGPFQLRWALKGQHYTLSLAAGGVPYRVLIAELGANDPHDNLRHEPAWLIRADGVAEHRFAAAVEWHGEATAGQVRGARLLAQSAEATAVLVEAEGYRARWLIWHGQLDPGAATAHHELDGAGATWRWTGPVDLRFET